MKTTDEQKQVWDQLWSTPHHYQWDEMSQEIFEKLESILGSLEGLQLVEAGSGTGKISLRLASEGAQVTLVDYSQAALDQSKQAFATNQEQGAFILGDIRDIPLEDNICDVCWSAGVLEHFDESEQIAIVNEMKRVTRPGGYLIVMTPSARCLPYLVGKHFAEQHQRWMYGKEVPVDTLKPVFSQCGLPEATEDHIGFLSSLPFLDFIDGTAIVKQALRDFYTSLDARSRDLLPGYLLVTVARIPSEPVNDVPLYYPDEVILVNENTSPSHSSENISDLDLVEEARSLLTAYYLSSTSSTATKKSAVEQLSDTASPLLLERKPQRFEALLTALPVLRNWINEWRTLHSNQPQQKPRLLEVQLETYSEELLLLCALAGCDCHQISRNSKRLPWQLSTLRQIKWASSNIDTMAIPGSLPFDIILMVDEYINLSQPDNVLHRMEQRLTNDGLILLTLPFTRSEQLSAEAVSPSSEHLIEQWHVLRDLQRTADEANLKLKSIQAHNEVLIVQLTKQW